RIFIQAIQRRQIGLELRGCVLPTRRAADLHSTQQHIGERLTGGLRCTLQAQIQQFRQGDGNLVNGHDRTLRRCFSIRTRTIVRSARPKLQRRFPAYGILGTICRSSKERVNVVTVETMPRSSAGQIPAGVADYFWGEAYERRTLEDAL